MRRDISGNDCMRNIISKIRVIEEWDIPNVNEREAEFCRRECQILRTVLRNLWIYRQYSRQETQNIAWQM